MLYNTYFFFYYIKTSDNSLLCGEYLQRISDSNGCGFLNQISFKLTAINHSANSLIIIPLSFTCSSCYLVIKKIIRENGTKERNKQYILLYFLLIPR